MGDVVILINSMRKVEMDEIWINEVYEEWMKC